MSLELPFFGDYLETLSQLPDSLDATSGLKHHEVDLGPFRCPLVMKDLRETEGQLVSKLACFKLTGEPAEASEIKPGDLVQKSLGSSELSLTYSACGLALHCVKAVYIALFLVTNDLSRSWVQLYDHTVPNICAAVQSGGAFACHSPQPEVYIGVVYHRMHTKLKNSLMELQNEAINFYDST